MVNVTINGQSVTVPEGSSLLQAVRAFDIYLPTLCHHEGLAPYGACRLCMVTVTAPRRALVAACAHPVEEGLEVETGSEEAVKARRLAVEFLLGRAPESDYIRELSAREGVTRSRFGRPAASSSSNRLDELCVLCGLCVRVCQEAIGAAALGFTGRGVHRNVSTPFGVHSEACIGCGACAEVCPTGAIRIEDQGARRVIHTWNTSIELVACPDCGRFFAPQPSAFLRDMLPEATDLWSACPDCRRHRTARQWLSTATGK